MTQVVPFPQASQQPPVLNQGQQMNALQLFESMVPSNAGQVNDALKALMGGVGGGAVGPDKISIEAGRFRKIVGGEQVYVHEGSSLDVIILGAVPYVSRVFYKGKYVKGSNDRPACSSANGVESDAQVEDRQSDKCATCYQNTKGSRTDNNGAPKVACGFRKQLAIYIWGDPEAKVYLLDLPAASIFGDGKPAKGLLSFNGYVNLMVRRGVDPRFMVTRLQFDVDTEYPCVLFAPALTPDNTAIQFVPQEHQQAFIALSESEDVKKITTVAAPGTVVQVNNAPALAAPVQQATPALAAPQVQPQVAPAPQAQAQPVMPSATPNVPPMPSIPAMPVMPAMPQVPAAVATAPVSQPVMPTVGASVTNVAAPAPAVASVQTPPAFPSTPNVATAPTPQPVSAGTAAPVVEVSPIEAGEVAAWLAGLSAPAAQ